jgi:hypothetical protein
MAILIRILIVLHFIGLVMVFAATIANAVMYRLIGRAEPQDKMVLGRFPPIMGRIGSYGLVLLWCTGIPLLYLRWGGLGALPWTFHVKLTAAVIVTLAVGATHAFARKAEHGDAVAAARIATIGGIVLVAAFVAVVFAVLTFA